ncbi:PAAR domain-containing protein [Jannaschia aquimarina]|uniref:PAAR motif protein n=1 Tax=Jannaschia aquimarina TaxID=935700 RepID=A0A0D1CL89_9RHOB|nr:PAAR domain-containing protein [Jannaschia aquimarina]KIT15572.1 PAAR motif protein [Jannaschia aquimarina]SNT27118.1 Zn-binding Pro-Ala-Ala-Arg (PAAR) domain-containing protein, incolved in TypeVI secretion [Jannaschia aquimarina]
MPKATRLGDTGSGHACHFPSTPATGASPDVFVNGIAVVRQGDSYAPHACPTCPASPHPRSLSGGSGTVFVNGKPAGRVGDSISCGGSAAAGSGDVSFGD